MGNEIPKQQINQHSRLRVEPSVNESTTEPSQISALSSVVSRHNTVLQSLQEVDESTAYIAPTTPKSTYSPKSMTSKSMKYYIKTPMSPPDGSTSFSYPKSMNKKRKGSFVVPVNNGITGKYISTKICKIAATFWKQNVESLSVEEQLEIGCSVFFSMIGADKSMKELITKNMKSNKKIEEMSLRYLDMLGWLIRHLMVDKIDLHELLTKLGIFHQKMGIQIKHFNPMLQAMHESFAYYFGTKYNIQIKYSFDEIFSLAAQVMTGQSLKCDSHLMDIAKEFKGKTIPFLTNLDACLKSSIGQEYIYRYFSQTWCDELAIFLKSLLRFKTLTSNKERFMVARNITRTSICPTATFSLNLSFENRTNAMNRMKELEKKFACKEEFEISAEFFSDVENETMKLIRNNHWNRFVEGIQLLQSKSQ